MMVTWCWGGVFWAETATFLSAHYAPGPILGAPETAMSKTVEHQHCLLFNCAICSFSILHIRPFFKCLIC